METCKIKPLGKYILVQEIKNNNQTKDGFYIPDSAKEKPQEAKVIALGTDEFDINVGDTILISKNGGIEIQYNNEEYKILTPEEVLAIIA